MFKTLLSLLLMVSVVSCGPDPITRASNSPWSSKNQSVKTIEDAAATPRAPMVVDGNTVYERALSVLLQAVESPNPRLRANAIESLQFGPTHALETAVRIGLGDTNRGVRFVAAMMIGDMGLCDYTMLLEPLLLDESESVRAAAIYALHTCNEQVNLNPLAAMLQSDNPELRGNAVMILGRMGNTSAIHMIRNTAISNPKSLTPIRRRLINLQVAEALVKLGEDTELEVIRAAIFSSAQESEVTALACQIAGRLQDVEIAPTLQNIVLTPQRFSDEIRLIAATALAEIAPTHVPMESVLRFTSHDSPSLRSQCAAAIGIQGNQLNLGPLALMLQDRDPIVQISAAGAVLRIDNDDSMAIVD